MEENYKKIVELIERLGNDLVPIAGKIDDIGVKKKWLTEQDIKIETELANLIGTFPGENSIYAEEIHTDFSKSNSLWVIDPISHTYNFLHGLAHYCVVLSHVHQGEVVFAVVYDPVLKELFMATKGRGATLNGIPISVDKSAKDISIFYDSNAYPIYSKDEGVKLLRELLDIGTVMTFGSYGLHYAYVACGRAHIAITRNQDTFPEFAGKLILEEAGGRLTDFAGAELSHESRGILATNGVLHDQLINVVKKYQI